MKHCYLLILTLICAFVVANAQHKYIPIPEDSAIWITYHVTGGKVNSYDVGRTEGHDTVLGGYRYFGYFGDWPFLYVPIPAPKTQSLNIAADWFRQDTIAKKVWFSLNHAIPPDELLVYDFSLNKGDIITDTTSMWFRPKLLNPFYAWVNEKDSVYWPDGTWRYRWFINAIDYLSLDTMKAVMIEGMGFTTHFWHDPYFEIRSGEGWYRTIGCFSVKGQWLISNPNPWNADCDTMLSRNVVTSVDEIPTDDLSRPILYPNPAFSNGVITLNRFVGRQEDHFIITAVNSIGKTVFTRIVKPGTTINLNEYSLSSGIYFFIVYNKDNGNAYKLKLIIQ